MMNSLKEWQGEAKNIHFECQTVIQNKGNGYDSNPKFILALCKQTERMILLIDYVLEVHKIMEAVKSIPQKISEK